MNLRDLYDGELEGLTYDRMCLKSRLMVILNIYHLHNINGTRTVGFLGYKKIMLKFKRILKQIEKNYITEKWPKVLFIEPSNVNLSYSVLYHRAY